MIPLPALTMSEMQRLSGGPGLAAVILVALLTVAAARSTSPQALATNTVPCASLRGLSIPASSLGLPTSGATITFAALVPASPMAVSGARVVLPIPEYCRISGGIAPVDPSAPLINFQINLPSSWNQKLAQLGGSGGNGVIPPALTTDMQVGPESLPPNAPYALSRGFVTYGSDSGHQDVPPSLTAALGSRRPDWMTNDEAFSNFAYGQMKKMHDVVAALVAKYYGQPIRHSYYLGSSQGGREALTVVQRFPQDYDGVFAQVVAPTWVYNSIVEPLARARSQSGDGWIPPTKVPVIGKEVLRQCDDLDGIRDGLVSNYSACYRKFDPVKAPKAFAAVRCSGGKDTSGGCLSDAQIKAAQDLYATTTLPFPLAHGWTTFPGLTTGGEFATSWRALATRPTAESSTSGMFRARIARDSTKRLSDANLGDYAKAIQALSAEIDPTNPDLSAFSKRGGKLIMKVNTADYSVNPRLAMAYHDRLVQTMGRGAVDEFMRFYVAVGLSHYLNEGLNPLTNASVPHYFDPIAALDEWVERGKTPGDTVVLSDMDATPPFAVRATFPMCRYPLYPRYRGNGDPKAAASYACTQP